MFKNVHLSLDSSCSIMYCYYCLISLGLFLIFYRLIECATWCVCVSQDTLENTKYNGWHLAHWEADMYKKPTVEWQAISKTSVLLWEENVKTGDQLMPTREFDSNGESLSGSKHREPNNVRFSHTIHETTEAIISHTFMLASSVCNNVVWETWKSHKLSARCLNKNLIQIQF